MPGVPRIRFERRVLWRSLSFLCVVLLGLPGPRLAHAQGSPPATTTSEARTVSVEYDPRQTSALLTEGITRLVAELNVAGFAVRQNARSSDESDISGEEPAGEQADDAGLFAQLRLRVIGDQLELEINSHSHGTSSHLVILGREREVPALALQAAEFLRAGLVPFVRPPKVRSPEALPAERERAEPTQPRSERALGLRVDLGASMLSNSGTSDQLPLVTVRAGYVFASRFALDVELDVPLADARFAASRGSAYYRIGLGVVRANYALAEWSTGAVSIGFCAGAARSSSAGAPDAPLEPRQASLWSLSLGAGAAVDYRFTPAFALVADARVLSLSPNPVVAVIDDERRLGNPSFLFGLGVRITSD